MLMPARLTMSCITAANLLVRCCLGQNRVYKPFIVSCSGSLLTFGSSASPKSVPSVRTTTMTAKHIHGTGKEGVVQQTQ